MDLEKVVEKIETMEKEINELNIALQEIQLTALTRKDTDKWLGRVTDMEKDISILKESFTNANKQLDKTVNILEMLKEDNVKAKGQNKITAWVGGILATLVLSGIFGALLKLIIK